MSSPVQTAPGYPRPASANQRACGRTSTCSVASVEAAEPLVMAPVQRRPPMDDAEVESLLTVATENLRTAIVKWTATVEERLSGLYPPVAGVVSMYEHVIRTLLHRAALPSALAQKHWDSMDRSLDSSRHSSMSADTNTGRHEESKDEFKDSGSEDEDCGHGTNMPNPVQGRRWTESTATGPDARNALAVTVLCEVYNDACVDVCTSSGLPPVRAGLIAYAILVRALGLVLELGHGSVESVQVALSTNTWNLGSLPDTVKPYAFAVLTNMANVHVWHGNTESAAHCLTNAVLLDVEIKGSHYPHESPRMDTIRALQAMVAEARAAAAAGGGRR